MSYANNIIKDLHTSGDGFFRPVLIMVVVIVTIAVSVLLVDWLFRSKTLPVTQVRIEGEFKNVTRLQLEEILVDYLRNNFLMLDLPAIQKKLETIPWIYRASIRRRWPSELHVSFMEQAIVARWGPNAWLNRYGDKVMLDRNTEELKHLPRLQGPVGTNEIVLENYHKFASILDPLDLHISLLTYGERGSWQFTLTNGISVALGKKSLANRLQRFIKVYPVVLAQRVSVIKRIDLRYTNGFSVQWVGAHAQAASLQLTDAYGLSLDKG